MLSIIVNDENYQNEEDIIDDFLVMFIAGAKTVQITTTNFIMMMKHRPDIKAKFEAEYQPLMEQVKDDIMKKMTPDLIENLEYTKMTYQEILRRYSPIPTSSTNTVSKTTTYNGVTFHKGDAFYVNLENIHKRDDEWKDCLKFIPERFDPHSEYYLRPDGKKRNPLSFNPFLGG
jgi:cytochrome P450